MWFNGTSLSEKARRALENEQVTIVSHITGHIHTVYKYATIDRESYRSFCTKLTDFVTSPLTTSIFINFLRFKSEYKCLFQYRSEMSGVTKYITLEKLLEYEHSSKYSVNEETRDKLLTEVEGEEFFIDPVPDKIILNDVESFLKKNIGKDLKAIEKEFFSRYKPVHVDCVHGMFRDIEAFTITSPRLPSDDKDFVTESYPQIEVSDNRKEICEKVKTASAHSEMAMLALYAFREMKGVDWRPFVKAAIERNPVCHAQTRGKSPMEIHAMIHGFSNKSIYDSSRLAQPDEVWNFRHGDGIEKAFLMADAIINNDPAAQIEIDIKDHRVGLSYLENIFEFSSSKGLTKKILIRPGAIEVS